METYSNADNDGAYVLFYFFIKLQPPGLSKIIRNAMGF